jgi:PBP1b-binding outer membrane lipoprotein LpoB
MSALVAKYMKYYFSPFLISFVLAGCSSFGQSFKSTENVSEYAELLFKQQNFLTQQVMMLSEEDMSLAEEEKISHAELQMHDACHLLIEYANHEIEGKKMSVFFRRRVKGSLNGCDESIKKMQLILIAIDENYKK